MNSDFEPLSDKTRRLNMSTSRSASPALRELLHEGEAPRGAEFAALPYNPAVGHLPLAECA